jgi:hypothetical protein
LVVSKTNADWTFIAAVVPTLHTRAPTGKTLGPTVTSLLSSPTTPQVIGAIVSEGAKNDDSTAASAVFIPTVGSAVSTAVDSLDAVVFNNTSGDTLAAISLEYASEMETIVINTTSAMARWRARKVCSFIMAIEGTSYEINCRTRAPDRVNCFWCRATVDGPKTR